MVMMIEQSPARRHINKTRDNMIGKMAAAATAWMIATAACIGNAGAQSLGYYSLDQVRTYISSAPDILILKESKLSTGTPSFILEYSGVKVGFFLTCPNRNYQRCAAMETLVIYPANFRPSLTDINDLNSQSALGRFYRTGEGDLAQGNNVLFAGLNAEGIRTNIRVMAAIAGNNIARSASASYEGGETSPGERIFDADHRPAADLGKSETLTLARQELGDEIRIDAAMIADAQTYGALRKLANELKE